MIRRLLPWLTAWALAGALSAITTAQSLGRYREFRSGYAWDLAWNNQWSWALAFGDGVLTVRPVNFWAIEGPSVWVHTHLDPVRLLILPIYALFPDPRTLIVVQNVVIWWVIPAAFGLVRSESGSARLGLLAAALAAMTPQLWPLAWDDYREMELAIPFVLWAVEGYRARRPGLTALGVAGMFACREEYGLLVATLALVPPRAPEPIGTTYHWSRAAIAVGLGWMLFVFFGYQSLAVSHLVPWAYMEQFGRAKSTAGETARAALELLVVGLGPWALLALFAPRAALLALLWVVEASRDRWSEGMLAGPSWHLVRYTAPAVASALAAGLVGFAKVGGWADRSRWRPWPLVALGLATAAGSLAARAEVLARLDRVPAPLGPIEAAAARHWIGAVGPEQGVLASYDVSAPLSSRRQLYSYVLGINRPPGYPGIAPQIRWAFILRDEVPPAVLMSQGFEVVYEGDVLKVYRRDPSWPSAGPPLTWPEPIKRDFHRPNPLVAALPALAPATLASLWARRRLAASRRAPATPGLPATTGAEVAALVLGSAGADAAPIVAATGPLADFYDPSRREVRLSPGTSAGESPAALAVAAHEAGHASGGRRIAALRVALVFASAWSATAGWLAVASGIVFVTAKVAFLGSLLVAASALIALALLPIESAAGRRARRALAGAGLGGLAAAPVFARALGALPLAPLSAVLPLGRRGPRPARV